MSLQINELIQSINTLLSNNVDQTLYMKNLEDAANVWGDVLNQYAVKITPPSITSNQAQQIFVSTFKSMSLTQGNGLIVLENSITQYALTLSLGMLPTFSSVINPNPIGLIQVLNALTPSNDQIAIKIASKIHNWFIQTTATNVNSGVSIFWN